jgi:PIN domain nuclease of toxin-antitoxin system
MEIICLHDRDRINLPVSPENWLAEVLTDPRIVALPISTEIALDAWRLPGDFHKDPADRIIVSSARVHDCPVMSQDGKIVNYPHVKRIGENS